jgi:hypothetical protein
MRFRQRFSRTFPVVLVLALMAGTGCSLFQPQQELATLCATLPDRNAGVICLKGGYTAVRDGAELVLKRYEAGRISVGGARDALAVLDQAYSVLEVADVALAAGDLREVEGRLNAAIELLNALEDRL